MTPRATAVPRIVATALALALAGVGPACAPADAPAVAGTADDDHATSTKPSTSDAAEPDDATAGDGADTQRPGTTAVPPPSTATDAAGSTFSPPRDDATDTSTATSDTGEAPPTGVVRFVAMGDGGEGNDHQYMVANAVEQICDARGCEFVLYLGDNFYDTGVSSAMDTQFIDKFEMPYADLDLPFYVTLGNHDYDLLGNAWFKAAYQIEYSEFSDKWTFPSEYYAFDVAHVTFIGLDTPRLFWNHQIPEQRAWLQEVLAGTDSRFTVAFGHHPYISNGKHGNAGNYDGLPLPIVDGQTVADFMEDEVCGKIDIYLSGHDHNRQWFPTHCGTQFMVAGTAATTTTFVHRDSNPFPWFEDDTIPGFAWIEIEDNQLTVAFYDEVATLNYENTIPIPE